MGVCCIVIFSPLPPPTPSNLLVNRPYWRGRLRAVAFWCVPLQGQDLLRFFFKEKGMLILPIILTFRTIPRNNAFSTYRPCSRRLVAVCRILSRYVMRTHWLNVLCYMKH